MSTDAEPTEAGAPASELTAAQERIAKLEAELAEARERADRYHSNWQRSAADFQNWKRRTGQEKADLGRQAEGAMTIEMLRVLDDFERAFEALPPEQRTFTWSEVGYMIGGWSCWVSNLLVAEWVLRQRHPTVSRVLAKAGFA